MLKRLLFILLLFGSLKSAFGQVGGEAIKSQQFKQQLRGQYLHNDTAQAIITLYSRRQAGGVSWITAASISALRLAIGGSTSNPSTSPYYSSTATDSDSRAGVGLLAAAPFVAYGVGKLTHYSNAHLSQVLTAYGNGQPLPHALRRKLRPRFFQAPIVQYKEVKYQAVK
jgi:hypothetical protein